MGHKMVHVVLRLDDPSALSPTDLEGDIIDRLRHHGMAATFGVIPFACTGDIADPSNQPLLPLPAAKVGLLERAVADGTVEVALHGYSHQTASAVDLSEFAGRARGEQLWRLAQGKAALEAAKLGPVRTFIPPWNVYDRNTLGALEELEFRAISADWKGVVQPEGRLQFVPATADLARLRDAVGAARCAADAQPLVVVLFHPYDFTEVDAVRGRWTREGFAALLAWLGSQTDVRVLTVARALEVIPDLGADRFLAVGAWRAVQTATPVICRETPPILVYHEAAAHGRALRRLLALYGVLGASAAAAGLCAWALIGAALPAARWAAAAGLMLFAGAVAYGVWGLGMSPGAIRSALRTRTGQNTAPSQGRSG